MLILVLLSTIVLANAAETTFSGGQKSSYRERMDGWHFFKRHMKYYLLRRTYAVPGGSQNAMCVQAPFSPKVYTDEHKLEKTFTYRNISSTHKIDPVNNTSAPRWPVAKFLMQFYVSQDKRRFTHLMTKQGYNYVNSTHLTTAFGYALPEPEWNFLYSNRRCAVVTLPPLTHRLPPVKPHCELWVSVNKTNTDPEFDHKRNWFICDALMKRKCDNEYEEQVYNSTICGPVFEKSKQK
ncbi:uncharacterized protein LOC119402195 [Rhipicephalus sanguineus]|uniref:uncharacterized protein LOC119402195 n=1 Tax=Rhipicephalus sanguineus TaxID=34632 RepID=UPI0018945AE3|nr:uncharacterized protein LOC119402195 [Rhipicephalus sanguineus]